jgi:hypothetical protein
VSLAAGLLSSGFIRKYFFVVVVVVAQAARAM